MVRSTDTAPIVAATDDYERWLHKRVDVVEQDLQQKHADMASSLFAFLRATFYRWGPLWLEVCPDLAETPRVLAVGDLHVENFGTWRDTEGRLVWGVNDFDEVARMPYAIDLASAGHECHPRQTRERARHRSERRCDGRARRVF